MNNKNEVLKGLYDLKSSITGEIFECENKIALLNESLLYVESEISRVSSLDFDGENINSGFLNKTNYDGKSRVRKMEIDINR
ncbi:MAG: hypothetical protein ACI310_05555 [Bacilli bacterium]